MNILFFGSTGDSVIIANEIFKLSALGQQLSAIITQTPKPIGRRQILTPTPVEVWAKENNIPVYSFNTHPNKYWLFDDEKKVTETLSKYSPDLILTASFGQKIPQELIDSAKFGGLNVHPSLLPRWRGGDPVPWAILAGDKEIGVTISKLSNKFDEGDILAQEKIPLPDDAFSGPLRTKLFEIGGELLVKVIINITTGLPRSLSLPRNDNKNKLTTNNRIYENSNMQSTYARRFTRDDGYIPWEILKIAMNYASNNELRITNIYPSTSLGEKFFKVIHELKKQNSYQEIELPIFIYRMYRALSPWPGLWTILKLKMENGKWKMEHRLKIIDCHLNNSTIKQFNNLVLDSVQLEGKKPVSWEQFLRSYKIE